ncbi:glutamate racemase [Geitlerinema sp. PCC 9228]|jgi:glutamate racemase|uniref:glutamate racemase n=1 Tax=Geitlerinema sp. PCC 9228 TaxID=111611 RepID=UPI0008F9DC21|nr:glutamate racemase [Geitlerinema sp. PCC 9228]
MTNPKGRIGIFDSGVGGLTVLKALRQQLPNESVLYFGDTARLPYGTKSREQILQYVREILSWMVPQVKMVMMACNTSSALALEVVQSEFDVPILGLILPGARAAVRQGRRIAAIATPATAASHAYRNAILETNPQVQVWEVGCPEFVPLIEAQRIHEPATVRVVDKYLQPLVSECRIDTLIYGCTHYPYLEPVLQKILPPQVRIIDPAVHVVAAGAKELDLLGLRSFQRQMGDRFTVSGCPQQFARTATPWLGYQPEVEWIQLPSLENSSILLE